MGDAWDKFLGFKGREALVGSGEWIWANFWVGGVWGLTVVSDGIAVFGRWVDGAWVWGREFFWKFVRINCQIFWVGFWDLKILPYKAGQFEKKCLANIFFCGEEQFTRKCLQKQSSY
jgi:hypothetical protein